MRKQCKGWREHTKPTKRNLCPHNMEGNIVGILLYEREHTSLVVSVSPGDITQPPPLMASNTDLLCSFNHTVDDNNILTKLDFWDCLGAMSLSNNHAKCCPWSEGHVKIKKEGMTVNLWWYARTHLWVTCETIEYNHLLFEGQSMVTHCPWWQQPLYKHVYQAWRRQR